MEQITYVGLVRSEQWEKYIKYIGTDIERAKEIAIAQKGSGDNDAIVELWVGDVVIQSFRYNTWHKEWIESENLEKKALEKSLEIAEALMDNLAALGTVSDAINGLEDSNSITLLLGSLNKIKDTCLELTVSSMDKVNKKSIETEGVVNDVEKED
ncbi:hypothetical protein CHOTACABRAS_240 [Bacillus phage Chotacabras]|nr:hypothetical protein CHOTACABRAS_240 [Bacillus phage Chotacabras]